LDFWRRCPLPLAIIGSVDHHAAPQRHSARVALGYAVDANFSSALHNLCEAGLSVMLNWR
jgi:hypothetical protein